MNKKIIYTSILLLIIAVLSLLLGLYWGRNAAVTSIKSELVWYNQSLLKQAVDDIKNGRDAEAEKKILYVDKELGKMKEESK